MTLEHAKAVESGDTVFYHSLPYIVTAVSAANPSNPIFRLAPTGHDHDAGKWTSHALVHDSREKCDEQRKKLKYVKH